jgi:hypothetical protein
VHRKLVECLSVDSSVDLAITVSVARPDGGESTLCQHECPVWWVHHEGHGFACYGVRVHGSNINCPPSQEKKTESWDLECAFDMDESAVVPFALAGVCEFSDLGAVLEPFLVGNFT